MVTNNQSIALDLFRVLMLMQVILGHTIALSIPNLSVLLNGGIVEYIFIIVRAMACLGRESAFLFIFLSGYFVGGPLVNFREKFSLLSALRHRLIRLFPVMIIALLITALVDYIGVVKLNFPIYSNNSLVVSAIENLSLKVFVMNIFALQPTFSPTFGTNGPLWTLGYIIQFNLLAYIFRSLSGNKYIFFITMIIFSLIVSFFNLEFALLFIVWVVGAFVYHHDDKWLSNLPNWFVILLAFLIVSFAHFSSVIVSIALISIVGALVITLSKRSAQIKSVKFLMLINVLSRSSYATYAVHLPIVFLLGGVLSITTLGYANLNTWLFLFATPFLSVIIGILISKMTGAELMKGR